MSLVPYNDENREKVRQIAERIQGTCGSLDDAVQEAFGDDSLSFTDLDQKLLEELDDAVMECQGCGWWCETGELDDDQICEDCQ